MFRTDTWEYFGGEFREWNMTFHNRDHSHHFKASNMWDNSVKLITKGPYSLELQNSGWRNKKKKKRQTKECKY